MATTAFVLMVLAVLVSAVWIMRHARLTAERRNAVYLHPQSPGLETNAPLISVVVSAKDERDTIETCVRSMLSQDYPNFEMIVCDDRSSDGTAEIVEAIARDDPRVRLVRNDSLPAGWSGKCHGMSKAVALARGDWLCMIDADCRQLSPRTLSVAMRHAIDNGIDLLSVLPVLEMNGFWENVVQPVCGGVMMIWFDPRRVNSPKRPTAYANGAFMLISRDAYQAIGTHQAVRDKLMEDMHLASLVKRAGRNLKVIQGRDLYVVRMYTSLRQILRGWSRIFFATFGTLPRLTASIALIALMSIMPYAAAIWGLTAAFLPQKVNAWWLAAGLAGVAAVGLQLSVIYRFYKLIGARRWLAWTYLIGSAVTMLALVMAMTKHRKGATVTWRNTVYSGESQKNPAGNAGQSAGLDRLDKTPTSVS